MDLGAGVRRRVGVHVGVGWAPASLRSHEETSALAFSVPIEKGDSVEFLTDILVLLGIAAAVGVSVLYVYLADRVVSGR